ncbi:protocadherin-8-like [Astyanax mexicanus]|uniref:Protocadherin-8 n=1 Tax=Astyanax mexicanus TaxID=7994 RepID=A0A8B9J406_ASTMX|nr:protocadherin-8-like [Astyanax mexicanus]
MGIWRFWRIWIWRCSLLLACEVLVVFCTTAKYSTFEEDAPGTEIGNLSQDLKLDPGEDPETTFRFMQKTNGSVIEMRPTDGLLTVGEVIDRERLCLRTSPCLISFDVVAFSKEKFQLVHVEIEVKDVNDYAPRFPRNETHVEVLESAALGTRILLDVAVDQDVGENYIQSYHISHSSHFIVETSTREDGVRYAELVLVKKLDRELDDSYILDVTAVDGGTPNKLGSMIIYVKVFDCNDNSPTFEHSSLKVELSEDSAVGVRVLKVHAFDPDDGLNGQVVYRFASGPASEASRIFHIDSASGEVTLKENVDYEKRRSYELQIEASDLGENSASSTCRVVIDVVDINDNAPEISIKPMTSTSDGVAYITEAAAQESFVALISTTDLDSGSNGYVRTSLQGHQHFRLQQAYGDTFMIVTTAALDREQNSEYNLTIVAEDLGSPPFKTVKHYTIRISDENDNAPQFSQAVYEVSVLENNIPGSFLAAVLALDLDVGKNAKVEYSLVDGQTINDSPLSTFVSIDPLSGSLYSLRSFDFESLNKIQFSVQAKDRGSPSLSSSALVRVKVVDENDNFPYFTYPEFKNESADVPLPCSAPTGFLALRVAATDEDDGANGEVSFLIIDIEGGDKKFFSIDKKTGAIVLKQKVTSACGDMLQIKVSVSDNGKASLSSVATIRFIITDTDSSEDQMLVLLKSKDEDLLDFNAWTVVFLTLAGGCALLLVAFAVVTVVSKLCRRKDHRRRAACGLYGSTPFSINSAANAGAYSGTRVFLNNERDLARECLYEDKTMGSEEKLFLPCKPFEQTNLWQDEKYCLQKSVTSNTDQLSMKDSGKGDSDFNDSDSDVSGEGLRRNLTTFQPWAKGSFVAQDSLVADWQGRYGGSSSGDVYTIGFSQSLLHNSTHANPHSWKEACYGANTLNARNSAVPYLRTETLPSYSAHQAAAAAVNHRLEPGPDELAVSAGSEIATTF